jgi:bifunctional DNA-binding transcriptional regulator/antitoxin component of YhaV-PrlF toxin-antitoxin module
VKKGMIEKQTIRSRVSAGYQVAVPAQLRKKYGIGVGDEVVWIVEDDLVKADFRKKPALENIASLGHGGKKGISAVELKKRVQRGEV